MEEDNRVEQGLEPQGMTAERAHFMGKWLTRLFWLNILNIVANVLTQEEIINRVPPLYWVGSALNIIFLVGYILVLFRIAPGNAYYRKAGFISGALAVGGFALGTMLAVFLYRGMDIGWMGAASVVILVGELVAAYYEIQGHAQAVRGIDDGLAEKWKKNWRWLISLLVAFVPGIMIMLLSEFLGMLIIMAILIGMIVVSIQRLVYLYKTARSFKQLAGKFREGEADGGA